MKMIFVNIVDISDTMYSLLVDYIFYKCDKVTFHFPRLYMENEEYKRYIEKNSDLLSKCFMQGAKQYTSLWYGDRKIGGQTKIIEVKTFSYLKEMIIKNHMFQWLSDDLPEDLCFYKGKKIQVSTIAHEDSFRFENETEEDLIFLKENGFDYFHYDGNRKIHLW